MTDTAEQAIRDAQHAQVLLEDPMVAAAFADLEAQYLAAWRSSPARDTEARERLYVALKVLDGVKADFYAHIANGKVERDRIEWLQAERNAR
jgi:hypothetical protein